MVSYYCRGLKSKQREIWNRDEEGSHADIGHVTKSAIFQNSRWRMAAILKIVLSLHNLSHELSDFDQIWYTGAYFHSEHGNLTKNGNFSNHFWAISPRLIGRLTRDSERR